jgi:tRNA nucleotidyltransferase/poly(A) polymerase
MFRYKNTEIEFVGARKESYNHDSRKPVVEDGTLQDDQNRRDFTINTMAFGLNEDNYGNLIDPFDGMSDLRKKQIKTPLDPDITFSDDPLRMMRGIRFAAQLNFDITPDTFDAIIKNAERIKIVSQERIIAELEKIIMTDTPSYGFKLLFHAELLQYIFPEMVDLYGVDKIKGNAHKDNFYHTLQVLDNVSKRSRDPWLRWAAIMHDIAKPVTKRYEEKAGWTFHGHEEIGARMIPRLFRRLKLPLHDKMRFVQKLVRLHLRPIALVSSSITDSAVRRLVFEAGDDIDKLMLLCKADITSKNPEKVSRYLNNFEKVEKKILEVEEKDKLRNFQPPISGEEIMKIFNIPPGREVGIIKNEIKEAILDGKIENNHSAAKNFMLELGKGLGLKTESKK